MKLLKAKWDRWSIIYKETSITDNFSSETKEMAVGKFTQSVEMKKKAPTGLILQMLELLLIE